MDKNIVDGPTGETCLICLHLTKLTLRFTAFTKISSKNKKALKGELPSSYQRNFTKGFDGFLCLHLGLEPEQIIDCVKSSKDETQLDEEITENFPKDLKPHIWNRKVVQIGTADMAKDKLKKR